LSTAEAPDLRRAVDGCGTDATAGSVRASWSQGAAFLELCKPRITVFVLLSAATGFFLGFQPGAELGVLVHLLIGTALVAAGTNGFNHLLEREVDGRMARTRGRPLPTGRLTPPQAGIFSGLAGVGGVTYLALLVNLPTAGLALGTLLIYDVGYTPLKRLSPLNTWVGAVPGALPIAGGWTAARGSLGPEALALFGILFLWQLPHFLSLAWVYREDYREAGLAMLPVGDAAGSRTRLTALAHTLALLPVSLLPSLLGLTGPLYLAGALGLGLAYLGSAGRFAWAGDDDSAWRVFRMSLLYLPLIYGLLILDKGARDLGVHDLPALNAVLNGLTTVLLVTGWRLIRRRRMKAHRLVMLAAVGTSAAFLASYLIYHAQVGSVAYQGTGWARTLYFAILISHSVLAATLVALVPLTLIRALRGRFDRHRRLARGTLPIWLYVSVTGIIVYLMLYVL
jgi:protoheme IX farnesyltransferase